MQYTYKIVSLLLDYPNREVREALGGMVDLIESDQSLPKSQVSKLHEFVTYARSISLVEWQSAYVQLFDFSTKNNLYLFDHIYGDSRERGQAMVDLKRMYHNAGFTPCSHELPDYLPLFLEYLSLLPNPVEAEKLLQEVTHILEQMKNQLEKRESPYAALLSILYALSRGSGIQPNQKRGAAV